MSATVIHLAISRDVLLTSNQRKHWAEKARHTRAIRDMAWVLAKQQKVRLMPAVTLEVVAKWGDRRPRDAANIEPTAKAAIDGCVDAGLLKDDSINDPHAERGTPERCKRDHEFTPENTIWRSDGSRMCRECKRQREREFRKKNECTNESLLSAARTEL